jgi:transcriptional regulator GlxA family with amidase domain
MALVGSLDAPDAPPVSRIADAYRVSPRTVERKVLGATGLPPSLLRRVLRFRRAFRMLGDAPRGTWARVAAGAGYFDQAHLIRDFRRFAGSAPAEFFRAEPDLAVSIMGADHGDFRGDVGLVQSRRRET